MYFPFRIVRYDYNDRFIITTSTELLIRHVTKEGTRSIFRLERL